MKQNDRKPYSKPERAYPKTDRNERRSESRPERPSSDEGRRGPARTNKPPRSDYRDSRSDSRPEYGENRRGNDRPNRPAGPLRPSRPDSRPERPAYGGARRGAARTETPRSDYRNPRPDSRPSRPSYGEQRNGPPRPERPPRSDYRDSRPTPRPNRPSYGEERNKPVRSERPPRSDYRDSRPDSRSERPVYRERPAFRERPEVSERPSYRPQRSDARPPRGEFGKSDYAEKPVRPKRAVSLPSDRAAAKSAKEREKANDLKNEIMSRPRKVPNVKFPHRDDAPKEPITKQVWKASTLLSPVPAVLVSCGGGETPPNVLTVAWAGTVCSDPAMLSISLRAATHSHGIIKQNREFVVNLPTEEQIKIVDFCGVASGRDVDKFEHTGLTAGPGSTVDAPIIMECPVNMECKVLQVLELGLHTMFIAEITAVQVSDSAIDHTGRLALEKSGQIAFAHGNYFGLGKKLGHFGFSVKKKK